MFSPCALAQLIESKLRKSKRRQRLGGRSWALNPFVVTKHQPSNGQRAMGHKMSGDAGSE
jgi:hypothetical protein